MILIPTPKFSHKIHDMAGLWALIQLVYAKFFQKLQSCHGATRHFHGFISVMEWCTQMMTKYNFSMKANENICILPELKDINLYNSLVIKRFWILSLTHEQSFIKREVQF